MGNAWWGKPPSVVTNELEDGGGVGGGTPEALDITRVGGTKPFPPLPLTFSTWHVDLGGELLAVTGPSLLAAASRQEITDFRLVPSDATEVTFNDLVGFADVLYYEQDAPLTLLAFPSLIAAANDVYITEGLDSAAIDLSALMVVCGSIQILTGASCDLSSLERVNGNLEFIIGSIASLAFDALVFIGGNFHMEMSALESVSLSSALKYVGGDIIGTGCALDQTSIDLLLARSAALNGSGGTTSYDDKQVDISGGTSSVPSSAGFANALVLTARGNTVTVNTSFAITQATADPTNTIKIAGNHTTKFTSGNVLTITGSTGNDGDWTVVSSSFGSGETTITVTGPLPDGTDDGSITKLKLVP